MQFINFISLFQLGAYFLIPLLPKPIQRLVTLSTLLSLASTRVLASGNTAFGVFQGLSTNSMNMNFMTANTDNTFNFAGYMAIGGLIANSNSAIGQIDDRAQIKWFHQQNAGGQNQLIGQAVMDDALYSVGFASISGQTQQPYLSVNNLETGELITAYSIGGFSSAARMTSLVATSNHTLICLGYTATTPFILEFDPTQGKVLSASYVSPAVAGAIATVITQADDGSYLIAGNTLDTNNNAWISKISHRQNNWISDWCQLYAVASSSLKIYSLAESKGTVALTGVIGVSALVGTLSTKTGASNWNTVFSGLGVPRGIKFQNGAFSNSVDTLLVSAYTQVGTPGGRSSGWLFSMNLNGTLHSSRLLAGTRVSQIYMSTVGNDGMINALGGTLSLTSLANPMFLRVQPNLDIASNILPAQALSYSDNTKQMTTQVKAFAISSYSATITAFVPTVSNITSSVNTITTNPITAAWQSYETAAPSSQPTSQPSAQPSIEPTQPSAQPSSQPTSKPSLRPSVRPSSWPTRMPSGQPSTRPTLSPSKRPSAQPSSQPTARPSSQPSKKPSTRPTLSPSKRPSAQPSSQPTLQPSVRPSSWPTRMPSGQPSTRPTLRPSKRPSTQPSSQPTARPSSQPSIKPSTRPTLSPSKRPSAQPTRQPSLDSNHTTLKSELNHQKKLTSNELSAIIIAALFLSALAPLVFNKNRLRFTRAARAFFSDEETPRFNQVLPDLNALEEGAAHQLVLNQGRPSKRRDSLLILLAELYIKIKKTESRVLPECIEAIEGQLSNTIGSMSSDASAPEEVIPKQPSLAQDNRSFLSLEQLLAHDKHVKELMTKFMNDDRIKFCATPTPSEFAEMDAYYNQRRLSIQQDDLDLDSSSGSSCGPK